MNRLGEAACNLWFSNFIRGGNKSTPSIWRTEVLNEKLAEDKKSHRRASLSQDQKMKRKSSVWKKSQKTFP